MVRDLPETATVLSAAGDGVAEQVTGAAIQGGKDWRIGYLPYGNFNDLARAHMGRHQTALDVLGAPTTLCHPLTVEINDELWRHVPGYMTLGMTARVAAGFGGNESRREMRSASHFSRTVRRLGQAASDYRRFSHSKLPAFRVNGGEMQRDSTDVAVANTPLVAGGVIRPAEPYYDTDYFGARADLNMTNVLEAASFGIRSLAGHSPLERMYVLRLAFEQAATVPAQTDGEYHELTGVHSIFVYKDPRAVVRVLHAKR